MTSEHDAQNRLPTPEQMEQINRFSRRPMEPEEVYFFPVTLCDNEVDRDFERFSPAALDRLAELFLGRTGIFDHTARTEYQAARIFDASVVEDPERITSTGEPLRALRAMAYMVRCDKNADLMLEIDAGIKKEVSVSCSVERVLCSVCGEDQKQAPCAHRKGQTYGGSLCHHILEEPCDAYEWSFVAVPAQKNAGVTKQLRRGAEAEDSITLQKLFQAGEEVTLSPGQLRRLEKEYGRLQKLAEAGEAWLDSLRRDVIRLGLLGHPGMDGGVLEQVVSRMDEAQLKAFQKAWAGPAAKRIPMPQLAPAQSDEAGGKITLNPFKFPPV